MSRRSVAVEISGNEYRVVSEADEGFLQRVASHVDESMAQIRERTGTVDTLDLALLTSLNLARELLTIRDMDEVADFGETAVEVAESRMGELIDLAEAAVAEGERLLGEVG
jgi:cell division protein ZapA (FtsZ GTPase activity inhibitor)